MPSTPKASEMPCWPQEADVLQPVAADEELVAAAAVELVREEDEQRDGEQRRADDRAEPAHDVACARPARQTQHGRGDQRQADGRDQPVARVHLLSYALYPNATAAMTTMPTTIASA